MALKIDISKAYDRVDWSYLEAIMIRLGFCAEFIQLILMCVTSIRYHVLVNGQTVGPIIPSRGLRQGCPLSPYLFLLCSEGLSALFMHAEAMGSIHGGRICRAAPRLAQIVKEFLGYVGITYVLTRGNVLDAPLGHNPSLIWRSMVSAKSFLRRGYMWRIVGDLRMLKGWNVDFIARLFSSEEVSQVNSIPFTRSTHADKLIWNFSSSGKYIVKSGYKLVLPHFVVPEVNITSPVWVKLWQLAAPPKVKHWLWRACRNILPTKFVLFGKRITEDDHYPFCDEIETIMHMLFFCEKARLCWTLARIPLDGSAIGFIDLLLGFIDQRSDEHCLLFVVLCYFIWFDRNRRVWQQTNVDPYNIVMAATSFLREWKNAQISRSTSSSPSASVLTWVPPPTGAVKCNFDAAVHTTAGRSSYAGLVRSEAGQFLVACTGHFAEVLKTHIAEAIGLREVLSWLLTRSFGRVLLETDCLRLFQAVTAGFEPFSDWAPVLEEIKQLLSQNPSYELIWARRQVNKPAHALARVACLHPCFHSWDMIFHCIEDLIALDLL
ncbi:uncharacterized protein LOC110008809 [Jatropha curcas]|uniref:uncharacterized protein LOC110008809 n=1 Tax=Jatropha curcas TaxID=180498 RepID=UPI001893DE97|nr:uncharacterized protein LOC110008809 [Jatropha curcas]